MPIYEFKCAACNHVEEILQKVSDPAPAECPSCHQSGTLHKEVSHTSFQLKGGGWYGDLYASKKPEAKTTTTDAPTAPHKE